MCQESVSVIIILQQGHTTRVFLPYQGGIFMTYQKHLSLTQRIIIEKMLNERKSFKAIARELGKHCTTISKEVRNHRVEKRVSAPGRIFNHCAKRDHCDLYGSACDYCIHSSPKRCRGCSRCTDECSDFVEEVCPKLSSAPYVCNGCTQRSRCTLMKTFYSAEEADKAYRLSLSESRTGFNLTEAQIRHLDDLMYDLITEKGQSVHHVYVNHSSEIMMSEKTLYRLIDAGAIRTRNIDLRLKVRRRTRRNSSNEYKVDKACLEGRRYEDYLAFIEKNGSQAVVEMDTVEGQVGGSCLLTIHFTRCEFMLAFKRDYNDSKSVTDIFEKIYETVGPEMFRRMFPVILTDNGSEFSDPAKIEFDKDGNRRTFVFYCHPSSPYEKGSCEVNHENIRLVIPKGKSLDPYVQDDICLMMSHINSYARASLNDSTPYSLFVHLFSEEVANLFGIGYIQPDDIVLKPKLLSKK